MKIINLLAADSPPDGNNLPGVKKCILGKLWQERNVVVQNLKKKDLIKNKRENIEEAEWTEKEETWLQPANGTRKGDTRGERELPLSSNVDGQLNTHPKH